MAARLLLIEDDASIARFVELALDGLPDHDLEAPAVELTVVASLREARAALAAGGWQLVISDLMLPDGSAESLLAEGLALGAGAPPWVVFSAGVQEERRATLAARGVACLLRKPVPLMELLDTIAGLLRQRPPVSAAPWRRRPWPIRCSSISAATVRCSTVFAAVAWPVSPMTWPRGMLPRPVATPPRCGAWPMV